MLRLTIYASDHSVPGELNRRERGIRSLPRVTIRSNYVEAIHQRRRLLSSVCGATTQCDERDLVSLCQRCRHRSIMSKLFVEGIWTSLAPCTRMREKQFALLAQPLPSLRHHLELLILRREQVFTLAFGVSRRRLQVSGTKLKQGAPSRMLVRITSRRRKLCCCAAVSSRCRDGRCRSCNTAGYLLRFLSATLVHHLTCRRRSLVRTSSVQHLFLPPRDSFVCE